MSKPIDDAICNICGQPDRERDEHDVYKCRDALIDLHEGLRAALRDVLPFIVDERNQSPQNAAVAAWWRKHAAVLATIPRPGEQEAPT